MTIQTIKNKDAVPIRPVAMLCDQSLGDVAPPFPNGAFTMLMSAKPGSGKTTALINLIESKAYYRKKYENIYAFIPPNSLASLPKKSLLKKHDKIYGDLTIDNLEKVLEKCRTASEEEENTLIIIDDFLHALKQHDILQALEFLIMNRRHMRTSMIICAQVFNSLPLILRKSLSHVMLWKIGSGAEQTSVLSECFPGAKKEDAEELLRIAHPDKHSFLFIDLKDGRYYNSDLDELVIVQPDRH